MTAPVTIEQFDAVRAKFAALYGTRAALYRMDAAELQMEDCEIASELVIELLVSCGMSVEDPGVEEFQAALELGYMLALQVGRGHFAAEM